MFRLSREADYSLLAMMYLVARPAGELAFRREIAAHYNIPREFLAKVLQKLSRQGLIRSFRGMQGGYVLAKDPGAISLADVVEAVDGPLALVDCQCEPYECRQESACTVQETMRQVQMEIRKVLCGVSLRDLSQRVEGRDRRDTSRLLRVRSRAAQPEPQLLRPRTR